MPRDGVQKTKQKNLRVLAQGDPHAVVLDAS